MTRIRQRTKHLIYAGLIGAGVMGLIFVVYAVRQMNQVSEIKSSLAHKYEAEIAALQKKAEYKKITGWVPVKEIPAGHLIHVEDLKSVEFPADKIPSDWMKSRDQIAGKIAKIKLRPQTLLTETLLYEEEPTPDDLRWREMSFVQLPSALEPYDVVDVRIQFPTGQDYILLSKKKVERLTTGTVTVTLDETEILSLSSAIVDAYLHKASIYALAYVEPQLQSKSVPTYPANEAVLQLIKRDPNIVKQAEHALSTSVRTALEQDLLVISPQSAAEFSGLQSSMSSKNTTSESEDSFDWDTK
jgi:hypothetical protein